MKKLLPLKFLILISFSILNLISCNRQDVFSLTNNDQSTKEMLVSYLNQQKNIDPSDTTFFDTLVNKADWNRVTEAAISNLVKIIYVPLNYNANNIGMTFLFNNKTQKIYYSLITEMPTNNKSAIHHTTATSFNRPIDIITGFYKKNLSDYTGFIRAYTISNNLLWEFGYKNGERKYEKRVTSSYNENPASNPSQIKSNSTESKLVKPNGCKNWYLVTWYNDGSSDWDYIGTTCSDECFNSIKLTQDSIRIKSNCGTAPQGGGVGSGASINPIITNNIKDPCLKKLITNLQQSNKISNAIGSILQNVFGKNNSIILTFNQDNNLKNDKGETDYGQAYQDPNDKNKYNITLNALAMSNWSQERQTLTIMHEVLHDYFKYEYQESYKISFPNDHTQILDKYIDKMASSLEDIYPNLKGYHDVTLALCFDNLNSSVGVGIDYLEIIGKGQIIPSDFNTSLGKHGLNLNNWHSIADQAKNNISPLGTQSQCPNKTIQD